MHLLAVLATLVLAALALQALAATLAATCNIGYSIICTLCICLTNLVYRRYNFACNISYTAANIAYGVACSGE